jgi:hypothetical protein
MGSQTPQRSGGFMKEPAVLCKILWLVPLIFRRIDVCFMYVCSFTSLWFFEKESNIWQSILWFFRITIVCISGHGFWESPIRMHLPHPYWPILLVEKERICLTFDATSVGWFFYFHEEPSQVLKIN